MEENNLYSSYRFVSGAMNLLCSSLTHIVYLLTAPLLVFLARDFGLDNATAGYASTVHICFMGLFLFVGPVVIGKIDIRKTQILGVTLMLAGLFLSYIAKSFPLFLLSRAVTGVGHGISGSCNNSVVAAWFPPREKSAAVTVNSLGIVAVTTLVYTCAVPLYHAFGDSWRRVMLLTLGVLAAADALWILLYRDNHALNAHIARENACSGRVVNAFSGMRQAVSRRDVWLVCLFMGLGSIASNGINTYLPQFLQTVRGYSDTAASAVVGVTAGIGAVGTFLGGRGHHLPGPAQGRDRSLPGRFHSLSGPFPGVPRGDADFRLLLRLHPAHQFPHPRLSDHRHRAARQHPFPGLRGGGHVLWRGLRGHLRLRPPSEAFHRAFRGGIFPFDLSAAVCAVPFVCDSGAGNRPRPEKARFDAKLAASLQVNIL